MWYESRFGQTSFNFVALLFKLFHSPLKAREHMEMMGLTYKKWTLCDWPKVIELLHIPKNVLPSTQIEMKLSWLCIMMHRIVLNSFFGWLFAIHRLWNVIILRFFLTSSKSRITSSSSETFFGQRLCWVAEWLRWSNDRGFSMWLCLSWSLTTSYVSSSLSSSKGNRM